MYGLQLIKNNLGDYKASSWKVDGSSNLHYICPTLALNWWPRWLFQRLSMFCALNDICSKRQYKVCFSVCQHCNIPYMSDVGIEMQLSRWLFFWQRSMPGIFFSQKMYQLAPCFLWLFSQLRKKWKREMCHDIILPGFRTLHQWAIVEWYMQVRHLMCVQMFEFPKSQMTGSHDTLWSSMFDVSFRQQGVLSLHTHSLNRAQSQMKFTLTTKQC